MTDVANTSPEPIIVLTPKHIIIGGRARLKKKLNRLRNFDLQAKRAVSLPDMLNEEVGDDKFTIGAARKIWMKQSQAKSSENLLL